MKNGEREEGDLDGGKDQEWRGKLMLLNIE